MDDGQGSSDSERESSSSFEKTPDSAEGCFPFTPLHSVTEILVTRDPEAELQQYSGTSTPFSGDLDLLGGREEAAKDDHLIVGHGRCSSGSSGGTTPDASLLNVPEQQRLSAGSRSSGSTTPDAELLTVMDDDPSTISHASPTTSQSSSLGDLDDVMLPGPLEGGTGSLLIDGTTPLLPLIDNLSTPPSMSSSRRDSQSSSGHSSSSSALSKDKGIDTPSAPPDHTPPRPNRPTSFEGGYKRLDNQSAPGQPTSPSALSKGVVIDRPLASPDDSPSRPPRPTSIECGFKRAFYDFSPSEEDTDILKARYEFRMRKRHLTDPNLYKTSSSSSSGTVNTKSGSKSCHTSVENLTDYVPSPEDAYEREYWRRRTVGPSVTVTRSPGGTVERTYRGALEGKIPEDSPEEKKQSDT